MPSEQSQYSIATPRASHNALDSFDFPDALDSALAAMSDLCTCLFCGVCAMRCGATASSSSWLVCKLRKIPEAWRHNHPKPSTGSLDHYMCPRRPRRIWPSACARAACFGQADCSVAVQQLVTAVHLRSSCAHARIFHRTLCYRATVPPTRDFAKTSSGRYPAQHRCNPRVAVARGGVARPGRAQLQDSPTPQLSDSRWPCHDASEWPGVTSSVNGCWPGSRRARLPSSAQQRSRGAPCEKGMKLPIRA